VPGAGEEGRSTTDWHCHGNASPHAAQLIRVRGPRGPGAHASVALSPSRRLINLPGLLRARAGDWASEPEFINGGTHHRFSPLLPCTPFSFLAHSLLLYLSRQPTAAIPEASPAR